MLRLPSPSMVVSCVALGVALGGTSYAAVKIPDKSVGQAALRNGAVGSSQLKRNAVDASKVRDHTLTAKDLKAGVLPAAGTSVVRKQSGEPVAAGAVGAVSASCQAGERATGGGGGFAGPPTTNDKVTETIPVGDEPLPVRWRISLFNGGASPRTPVAYVLCATG
jgi:hypothetical protein